MLNNKSKGAVAANNYKVEGRAAVIFMVVDCLEIVRLATDRLLTDCLCFSYKIIFKLEIVK